MSIKDEKIVEYILQCKMEAKDATRECREAGKELWQLYQNKQDYSAKKDWQAKCFVPKIYMAVNQSAAMVKRAILSTRKLFKLVPKNKKDEEAVNARDEIERLLKQSLDDSNFADVYGEMIKGCFLQGLGDPKVLWDGGLTFSNVDVFNLFVHPAYEPSSFDPPKYIIEEGEMDLAELKQMARRINKDARRSIYRMKALNEIDEDFAELEKETELKRRRGLSEYTKVDKKVHLTEFWGDIISEDGKSIDEKQLVIIANKKHIIRKQNFPFDDLEPPHILTTPSVYPHRGIWGESLVGSVVTLCYAYNNISNLVIDNLNWTVNKLFEVQPTNVANPRELTSIYPGKVIFKNTSNPAMTEVRTTGVGTDVYNMLNFLNGEMEKGTAITEFIKGEPGKKKTLGEVEIKTAQAQGYFDVIARHIEANSLAPLIKKSFNRLIQFGVIPAEFKDRYNFVVGGLSLLLARREQQEQISHTLMGALKYPDLKKMTDLPELYKKFLDLNNLGDVFAEEPQAPTAEMSQQMNELAAQDAKNAVAGMSPEEIEQALSQVAGAG